jgi:DNA polymerase-3 subunit epsilon
VYRFYGVNDLPIYIGKSINLRERVRSHFSADHRSANDLRISGEIRRIEVEETAGELGALLREAQLVKAALPLHNHRLRRKLNACFLRLPDLATAPEIVTNAHVDWAARGEAGAQTLYGPFSARPNVRKLLEEIAAEEGLCWRQLGWEKRGGPCFARQVRKCRGACIGEESPEAHNLRLATALAGWKLLDWPWPGQRVMVRERHPEGRLEEVHVFDRWCHVGTARGEDELEDLATARVEIGFDPDIYSMLRTYFRRHAYGVVPLPQSNPSDC